MPRETERQFHLRVGRSIQQRRRKQKISQVALAAEIDVHRNTLHRWERGATPLPFYHYLRIRTVLWPEGHGGIR